MCTWSKFQGSTKQNQLLVGYSFQWLITETQFLHLKCVTKKCTFLQTCYHVALHNIISLKEKMTISVSNRNTTIQSSEKDSTNCAYYATCTKTTTLCSVIAASLKCFKIIYSSSSHNWFPMWLYNTKSWELVSTGNSLLSFYSLSLREVADLLTLE